LKKVIIIRQRLNKNFDLLIKMWAFNKNVG